MRDPDTVILSWGPLTLWHRDPCTDGTDDSCGGFKRARHGDQEVLRRIEKDFSFEWNSCYQPWFSENGDAVLSTMGITLQMFRVAAWHHFKEDHRKTRRYMETHLYQILHFAENTVDTMATSVQGKYGVEKKEDRVTHAASVIYGCILRDTRRWWDRPRWHIHHWRFTWRW